MNATDMIQRAQEEFIRMGKTPINGVTSFSRNDSGWTVLLEALERKAIPEAMDILGLYELRLDSDGNLISLDRRKLRKRGETGEE